MPEDVLEAGDALQALWTAAVGDAGFDVNQVCKIDAASPPAALGAQWGSPHFRFQASPNGVLSREEARAVNRPALLEKHRVAVPVLGVDAMPADVVRLAAMMRHELEHGRQWETYREAFVSLNNLSRQVCGEQTGEYRRDFLNQVPAEVDANSAAAVFVRGKLGWDIDVLRADPRSEPLAVNRHPPQPMLIERMVAFLFGYRDRIGELARRAGTDDAASFMELHARGAGGLWSGLDRGRG